MKIKNSNKILILILALTIAIPLLVAQIYLHKIKKGDFTYEKPTPKFNHPELNMHGSLSGVKAIKIIGGAYPQLLGASILHSNLEDYIVTRQDKSDSIKIGRSGDTLIFKYYHSKKSPITYLEDHLIRLQLNLADNIPVYAASCHVAYPSQVNAKAAKLQSADFFLTRGAVLNLGIQWLVFNSAPSDTVIAGVKGKSVYLRDTTPRTEDSINNIYGKMGAVRIVADKSTVELLQPLIFNRLDLTMQNDATLKLTHPIKVKSLKANIDPKTKVVGHYKSVLSINELSEE